MILDKIALASSLSVRSTGGGIGLFGFDTVAYLFWRTAGPLSRIIFGLVGLAGLWCITLLFRSDRETGHAHGAV